MCLGELVPNPGWYEILPIRGLTVLLALPGHMRHWAQKTAPGHAWPPRAIQAWRPLPEAFLRGKIKAKRRRFDRLLAIRCGRFGSNTERPFGTQFERKFGGAHSAGPGRAAHVLAHAGFCCPAAGRNRRPAWMAQPSGARANPWGRAFLWLSNAPAMPGNDQT